MGPVSEAADVLFSEFNRLGVLQSQMFIKDPSFAAGGNLAPDPAVLGKFDVAIERSQALAEKRLVGDGNDRDALLASAFAAGLQAECLALVQKRNLAALHCARQATSYAQRLLAVCPDCYDAYVATGVGKYLIGSRTLPVRWILRANGFLQAREAGASCAGLRQVGNIQAAGAHDRGFSRRGRRDAAGSVGRGRRKPSQYARLRGIGGTEVQR